ncbi:MAG: DUF4153 domain-containing protein [Armatimonadetes bacterium]|nr:DUF4153 domain-containing protein [Armatimonadota bacterium]
MALPSLRHLLDSATVTLRRFPLVLFTSASAAVAVMAETRQHRIPAVLGLGISLLFAIAIIAERRGWKPATTIGANALGVGFLLFYFFSLPTRDLELPDAIRLALLSLATHLLCAFGPFVGRGYGNGFWKYNQTLFLRTLTAALFSVTLYAGLGLAVLAADKLLEIEPYKNIYLDLFCVIAGVFNTWFFLAGVPKPIGALSDSSDYPKGLKIFSQYVLIPLVGIYALILYLYSAKILLSWSWPIGWTSMPVFIFSVAGILAFLLLYPIREREEHRWIATYARWFFYLLLPLTSLPVLAMWQRIGDYGFTEQRYLGLVLAVWLAGLALFMILTRQRSIRIIPISLCIVAAVVTYGPWSATSVSIASQTARLEQLLVQSNLLKDGKILPTTPAPDPAQADTIRSLFQFLRERDGLGEVRQWFGSEAGAIPLTAEQIEWKLGVVYPGEYGDARPPRPIWKSFTLQQSSTSDSRAVDVAGFSLYVRMSGSRGIDWEKQTPLGTVSFDSERGVVLFSTTTAGGAALEINLAERALQLADSVSKRGSPAADRQREEGENPPQGRVTVQVEDATLEFDSQQSQNPVVVMERTLGTRTIRCIVRTLNASIAPEGRQAQIRFLDADVLVK